VHIEKMPNAPPPSAEDSIGLLVKHGARSVAYVSAAAAIDEHVRAQIDGVDALFFDGTFWSSDELSRPGLSKARAEDMAHWPLGGDDGSLRAIAALRAKRKIYTHINNTNPILREGSPERRAVEAAGCEVAFDGMELTL
jgi:pyrroloquinoline quinone biosynthesis protein B